MYETTFELEALTPIFISGADQRNIANEGLRPPSIRGLMRWWYRAIAGGIINNVRNLKTEESEIFGNAKKKSAIQVFSTEKQTDRDVFQKISSKIIHLNGRDQDQRYLWFSMTYGGNQNREVYLPGSKFTLTIRSDNSNNLKIALGALWCLIYLGGIGTRSRRGAGCLKVTKYKGFNLKIKNNFEFIFNGNEINEAKSFLEENLKRIFSLFFQKYNKIAQNNISNNFCILKKDYSTVSLVNKKFSNFKEALSYIGRLYKDYRRSLPSKKRWPFGLPIIHPSTKTKLSELRQASPILFGLIDLNDGVAVRITKFYTSVNPQLQQEKRWVKHHLLAFNSKIKEIAIDIPGGKK